MKILIAEDDKESRDILKKTLDEWECQVILAQDGSEAWKAVKGEETPTLAIIDWAMSDMDSAEFCQKLRQSSTAPYIYIITVIPGSEKEEIKRAIASGADDYIGRPIEIEELRVRLRAGRRIMELQRALRMKATYDALTGIWNRNMITEVLQRELARADREGSSLGVVMAGLDKFKQINDTYGHQAGDAVLREVAKRMRSALRSYDLLGRYSGKEFLILLPGCDMEKTLKVAERTRLIVSKMPIENAAGAIHTTVSLGAATCVGLSLTSEQLIQAATQAMQLAKQNGRNRVEKAENIV